MEQARILEMLSEIESFIIHYTMSSKDECELAKKKIELYRKEVVSNSFLHSVVGRSDQLLCERCEDNFVEEYGYWCNDCFEKPSKLITK